MLVTELVHELNNIAFYLDTSVDLLRQDLSRGTDSPPAALDDVVVGLDRIKEVVVLMRESVLRDLDRPPEAVDMEALIRAAATRVSPPAAVQIDGSLGLVSGDPEQLLVALLKVVEAIAALRPGQVVVRAALESDGGGFWLKRAELVIRFGATGPDIEDLRLRRLLTRHFKRGPDGVGGDPGLSTAQAILQGHLGQLRLPNPRPAGCWFELRLPTGDGAP